MTCRYADAVLPCSCPAGLKDAEECIKLAPDFIKGYSRKGHLQFFMKVGWAGMRTVRARRHRWRLCGVGREMRHACGLLLSASQPHTPSYCSPYCSAQPLPCDCRCQCHCIPMARGAHASHMAPRVRRMRTARRKRPGPACVQPPSCTPAGIARRCMPCRCRRPEAPWRAWQAAAGRQLPPLQRAGCPMAGPPVLLRPHLHRFLPSPSPLLFPCFFPRNP